MGFRYITYRIGFELRKRLGLLKSEYPLNPSVKKNIDLNTWRRETSFFGVISTDSVNENAFVTPEISSLLNGDLEFFSSHIRSLGTDYDWITNPETEYKYDNKKHWSDIQDYGQNIGDIKFVWEKSRFAYLFRVIRHDHFASKDHSKWVFNEINSWIDANPINCGPNYKCSQEISLRILNWTYALNFYKDSVHLNEDLFNKIIHTIYWQLKHIYSNINFSRIAVRNNHAITETLTLYLSSFFYPFFSESKIWGMKGKEWFEQEVDYQIYEDGTFLQFSMNYHRVVIQLFTWAFKSAEFFNDRFSQKTYDKAYKSVKFLYACQDEHTGWLPNYGNNDGALFFNLNSCDFRDYRPQLNALHLLLTGERLYPAGPWDEDIYWMKLNQISSVKYPQIINQNGWIEFKDGGYFILRDGDNMTFIRCGSHKNRPAQADNLHLDIWHNGQNVIFDGGSYKYNTDSKTLRYFMGTESHNTVMLDDEDQMLKGARFIWYNWSQAIMSSVSESEDAYFFEGSISAFRNIQSKIIHTRKVKKYKNKLIWEVQDEVSNKPATVFVKQRWHSLPLIDMSSHDQNGTLLELIREKGFRSDYYGIMRDADQFLFQTNSNIIQTTIEIK
jgi:hypothetical protein